MVIATLVINFMIFTVSYLYKPEPIIGLGALFHGAALLGYLSVAYRSVRKFHAEELALLLSVATELRDRFKIPLPALDGDCLFAAEVTQEIGEMGWRCETITIAGCNIDDVIIWMHEATCVTLKNGDTRIVDLTATQYDPKLPAVWIVPFDDYVHRLTLVTRVFKVRRV